ncbi:MAG: TIGR00366 family protein, partial [Planctomycetota bacterium]|nr:TIGR00366 family protein [Planctomycetota bacterium]
MIGRLGLLLSRTIGRFTPDPFVLALGLTILTAVLALVFGFRERGPDEAAPVVQLFDAWWNDRGIWKFLLFGMQMCLILVTGFALATSGPVRRIIDRLAAVPRGTGSAAALVALIAMLVGLVNWGLGLIVGALLAHGCAGSLSRRGIRVHYPLVCA